MGTSQSRRRKVFKSNAERADFDFRNNIEMELLGEAVENIDENQVTRKLEYSKLSENQTFWRKIWSRLLNSF